PAGRGAAGAPAVGRGAPSGHLRPPWDGDHHRPDPDRHVPEREPPGRDGPPGPTPGPTAVRGQAEGVRAADPPEPARRWHGPAGEGRPRRPERRGDRLGRASPGTGPFSRPRLVGP